MREMKDSGIEWIGNVPATWERCKIKNVISSIGSGTTPTSSNIDYYNSEDICWIQSGDLYKTSYISNTAVSLSAKALHLSALQIYAAPFIVVAMYGASVGNIAISTIDACSNQACCCIKPDNNNDLKFMYYWLSMCKIDFLSQSIGGGQPNISQSKIKNQFYYRPQLSEQKVIANFLDSKCSEIDAISADIQKEIETLEQYKRSVITEAVTKGLNPDVKMESVNIQYIVKKPSNWGILRLKYVLTEQKARTMTGAEDLLSVSQYKGVILATDNIMRTMQAASLKGYRIVHIGDLVFNKLNPGLARFGASDYNGITSPDYAVYKANPRIAYAKYLEYILKTERYVSEYKRQSTGVGDGFSRLYTYQLYEIKVALPPIDEQKEIIDYLQSICYKIETAIQEKKKQVDILNAYKKSLIYEYVTGKKEVV